MSNFTGMDIPAVRQLANQMRQRADEIGTITSQLTSQLQSTPWVGPDQQQFTGDWSSQHVTALNNVKQALIDAATRADRNAADQESVSNAS
jgi:uncharacterized protein YukE